MSGPGVFDPGLQPERTELAWRRTALTIGVGSLLALRVLPAIAPTAELAQAWLAPGVIGLGFAALLWIRGRARHARLNQALLDGSSAHLPGAGLLMLLTAFVGGCAVVSAVVVLLARLP